MQAIWTNPETNKPLPVFVHETVEEYGETFLLVNKGDAETFAAFRVRAEDTNVVVI